MKIDSTKVGTTFDITCTKTIRQNRSTGVNDVIYDSFEIHPSHTSVWGRKPEDVITVRATIIEEDVLVNELMKGSNPYDKNQIDYFGWVDYETMNIYMIYANIKSYFICFPYTPDVKRFYKDDVKQFDANTEQYVILHKAGDRRGMSVRLKIEEI